MCIYIIMSEDIINTITNFQLDRKRIAENYMYIRQYPCKPFDGIPITDNQK
jgi:hypothetical protein